MGHRARAKAFIVVFFLSLFTSCTSQNSSKKESEILHLNLGEEPESLDPRVVRTLRDITLSKQLFEGLMRLDAEGKPCLALAEHLAVSDDRKKYTFHLREALWTNGKPVLASDFLYAFQKVLSPDFASDFASLFFVIKNAREAKCGACTFSEVGVRLIDEMTLEFELIAATPYFLELLAFPTFFPIHAGIDERDPNWASASSKEFISCGPFAMAAWKQNEIRLNKNKNFWNQKVVACDELHFSTIQDSATEFMLFEKNRLDWQGSPLSQNLNPELINSMRKKGNLFSYPVLGTCWFLFNTEKKPFSDKELRKGLSYAINRREIIEHILLGNQSPATGILPPSMAFNRSDFFKDGNSKEAGALLSKYKDLKITLLTNTRERGKKIAQVAKEVWEPLGIEVRIESIEHAYYKSRLKSGEYDVAMGEWVADFNDPISFLAIFKNKGPLNPSNWENSQYIELLEKAERETSQSVRSKYLQDAEKILVDEMVVAPLYHYSFDYLKSPLLEGVILLPTGSADFITAKKSAK